MPSSNIRFTPTLTLRFAFRAGLWLAAMVCAIPSGDPALADEAGAAELLARGDAAFERRGDGQQGGLAPPAAIAEAVEAYEAALAACEATLAVAPEKAVALERLEAYGKLLHSLYFQGTHAATRKEERQAIFGRGKEVLQAALAALEERFGRELRKIDPGDFGELIEDPRWRRLAARIYFWGGANWGRWGQVYGKFAAARKGVAKKVRDYSLAAIELEPDYESGGGYRIHGRLHSEAPKIPLFTGWIDRRRAESDLRRALELGPEVPDAHYYLADHLLQHDKKKRDEALDLLRRLAEFEPRPEKLAEDAMVLEKARRLFEKENR